MQQHKTILLVEDEAVIAMAEANLLRQAGYEVLLAYHGEAAISRVLTAPEAVDLILMDIDLGKGHMDGTQAAQEILKTYDIPIIFLSSHTEPEVVEKTEKITSYGYIVKNSGITVLLASIKMAFKLHAAHQAIQHVNEKLEQKIAEHRQADEALKDNRDRFLNLANNIPGYIAYLNAETLRYEYVNEAFERSFGLPREKIIGLHIREVIGESKFQFALQYINAVRSGKAISYENTFDLLTGKRWMKVTYTPLFAEGGQVASIAVLGYDITDFKQLEEALRESVSRYHTVLQTAMDGFWLADMWGNLLEANDTYCQMSGYSQAELLSMKISDLEANETFADVLAHNEIIKAQGQARFESRHRRKDGSTYPIEVSVQYKPENGGRMVGFLRDISARKQAEDRLRDLHKELQHRAKNSFAMITSMIDLMDGPQRSRETREALCDIGMRVRGMAELYDLFYTTGTIQNVELSQYCARIAASCPFPGHIRLVEAYESIIIPSSTAAPVGMILTELLTNALKHAFPANRKGMVTIRLNPRADGVVMRVEDDGIGLPAGLDITESNSLGLRIVQALVMQIQGSFRIEKNTQAGHGAVCVVEFPLRVRG